MSVSSPRPSVGIGSRACATVLAQARTVGLVVSGHDDQVQGARWILGRRTRRFFVVDRIDDEGSGRYETEIAMKAVDGALIFSCHWQNHPEVDQTTLIEAMRIIGRRATREIGGGADPVRLLMGLAIMEMDASPTGMALVCAPTPWSPGFAKDLDDEESRLNPGLEGRRLLPDAIDPILSVRISRNLMVQDERYAYRVTIKPQIMFTKTGVGIDSDPIERMRLMAHAHAAIEARKA